MITGGRSAMTAMEYLKQNPGSSVQQISAGIKKAKKVISGEIANNLATGVIVREKGNGGVMVYSINDMPFGCSNRLTMMFNQLLKESRQ